MLLSPQMLLSPTPQSGGSKTQNSRFPCKIALRLKKVCYKVPLLCDKMLSYRRETALQGALQFSPKVEDWNWETIFYGHYKFIFNHCDIIGLKICRIR